MTAISPLGVGEPAPWFSARVGARQSGTFELDERAGRHIVLFFFGTASRPDVAEVLEALGDRLDLFDPDFCLLIGVSNDISDFSEGRLRLTNPGQVMVFDPGGVAAAQYLAAAAGSVAPGVRPLAFVLSPALQITEIMELAEPAAFVAQIASVVSGLAAPEANAPNAPVLVVPRVFDRAFCSRLIELYEAAGGREIGAVEHGDKVVDQFDPRFRKRMDWYISDEQTVGQVRTLFERRLLPMVYRAFQFRVTRIERYLVGCYDAERGGYFRPHRDNTAAVVAHRRFALTINLNDGYDGGRLSFPEFGHRSFSPAPGDAVVFSCSLLHEVTAVTKSRRFAFVSFLYDEQSQQMRDEYAKRWTESQKAEQG